MELGEHGHDEQPVADCDCRRCAIAERDRLRSLIVELMGTELADLACAGSMAPVEDVIGRMKASIAA